MEAKKSHDPFLPLHQEVGIIESIDMRVVISVPPAILCFQYQGQIYETPRYAHGARIASPKELREMKESDGITG